MPEQTLEEKLLDIRSYVEDKLGVTLTHVNDDGNRLEDLNATQLATFQTQICDKIRKPKNPVPSIGG